jgi:chorismate mutase
MIKKDPNERIETELLSFRKQIDEIDDTIISLLKERINIVSRVGEYKKRTAPGRCPIRPAREAEMIRRVIKKFEDSKFFPAAAAAMWRIIIGASTSVESNLTLSVFTPDRDNDYFWMAREYFGPFIPIIKQPHIKRVLGDVMDGKAAVGIVPMLRSSDTTFWWTNLVQQGNDIPKVFARIPFVYSGTPGRDAPSALAISRLIPEPSGDDCSLMVLEADHNVSQNKLQSAFANAKLDATWINIATLSPSARHHLIEVKGFVTLEHQSVEVLLNTLGSAVYNLNFIGAYAVPVIINNGQTNHETKSLQSAFSGK